MTGTQISSADVSPTSGRVAPIIPGFHPDPSICRVGEDYYLATSSFEYFPGVPIFHSRDLVSWTQIGHALTRRSQFRLVEPGPSRGIYAPTLRYHDGLFWLITTNVSDIAGGQLIVTTDDPRAEWSEPILIPEARGIDPDLVWDADGTCYLTWNALDFGVSYGGIRQATLDTSTGKLLEPDYPLWQGTGMQAAEGSHLYRIEGRWYQMLAEGGTERGHSVTIARGDSPRGPFEACPHNPILTHRSTDHPVQNVGHADLVQTAEGDWAAVYLGARPQGSTPGYHVNGRETFLAGITWVDGWPVFDETRYTGRSMSRTDFDDDFSAPELDMRWVTPDGEPSALTEIVDAGVRLLPRADGGPAICARVRDGRWTAEARFDGDGSLRLWMDPRHWYGIRHEGGQILAEAHLGGRTVAVGETIASPGAVLRIRAVDPSTPARPLGYAGPDDVELAVVADGVDTVLARLDGRYLSTEVASGFTGRMLAVSAVDGPAVLRRVTYRGE